MIWNALVLAAVGLFLSAFFSGSETGFYRAARMRLVLDALGGDFISRVLVWLTNHHSIFIATTLVGNNLANYVTTFAIVMGTEVLFGSSHTAQMIAPLVLAPFLFVYGELLPKSLFLRAPNRLLRMGGPLFVVFVPLFLPVSIVLWVLNKMLARLVRESPEKSRLTVARRELRRILDEGHETGILHHAQRELARGIFAVARGSVTDYITPVQRVARARSDMTKDEIRGLAQRLGISAVPVEEASGDRCLAGYVEIIDLVLDPSDEIGPLKPLLEIPHTYSHIDALMWLQSAKESIAQVVDDKGRTLGILTAAELREPLFRR